MSFSDKIFRDKARFLTAKDFEAIGKFRLDLTDPLTLKVKERIEGHNTVFKDVLLSSLAGNWASPISSAYLVLNDDDTAIDANLPYVRGQTIAYGIPSLGTLGTFRGAYNSANQVLAQYALDKVRWKFQYDFTIAQGNSGTIKNAGLTNQYVLNTSPTSKPIPLSNFKTSGQSNNTAVCDGRYRYVISATGIITKYDEYNNSSVIIDVSAIVGTVSGDYKTVGYEPSTGYYYIYVYSSTAANRKMYKFFDNTFSSLSATYSCSNIGTSFGSSSINYPIYIKGNYAYWFLNNYIYKADFVNNTVTTTISLPTTKNNAIVNEGGANITSYIHELVVSCSSRYILCGTAYSTSNYITFVFDLNTETFVAQKNAYTGANGYPRLLYPLAINQLPCVLSVGQFYTDAALTTYILPTPVTKTSANGMTATYELEVLW